MYNWSLRDAHMAMILTYSAVVRSVAIYYSREAHSDSSVYAGGTIASLMYKQKDVDLGGSGGLRELHSEMMLKLVVIADDAAFTVVALHKWSVTRE